MMLYLLLGLYVVERAAVHFFTANWFGWTTVEFIPICIILVGIVIRNEIADQHDPDEERWTKLYNELDRIKKAIKKKDDTDAPQ